MTEQIGRGWAFPPRFNRLSRTAQTTATDQEEIEQSLAILFATHLNERLFQPDYGCNLEKYKFQPMSSVNVARIRKALEEAINDCEPRITLLSLHIDSSLMDEGRFMLHVAYTINDTATSHNMVYPLNFE